MPSALMSIVEGWTGALPFTLRAQTTTQSSSVALDLTGMTIKIVLKASDGTIVKDTTAGITVTGTTAGQLEYAPSSSSGDLFVVANAPYRVRFQVTDALTRSVYHPNDEEELIEVNPR
jgi:hypothetical protein